MSLELFGLAKIWLNTFFSLRYEKTYLIIYQQCLAPQTRLRNKHTWALIGYAVIFKAVRCLLSLSHLRPGHKPSTSAARCQSELHQYSIDYFYHNLIPF
jgi:hypothetical protein